MNPIQSILPLIRVFQFFCLSPVSVLSNFRFCASFFFKVCSVLQIIVRATIFLSTILSDELFIRKNEYQIVATIDTVLICVVRLLEITILIEALIKRKLEIKFMENLQQIDEIIKNRLHVDSDYGALYRYCVLSISIWIGIFLLAEGTLIYLSYKNSNYFYFCLTYLPPFFVSSLTYFQIIIWVNLIKYRFKILKRFIDGMERETKTEREHSCGTGTNSIIFVKPLHSLFHRGGDFDRKLHSNLNSIHDAYLFDRFIIVRDLYQRLWDQTNLVNERFRWSMVVNIGNDFISLLSNFYWMIICLLDYSICRNMSVAGCFLWSFINISHIFALCRMCHHTVDQAAAIANTIHHVKFVANSPKLSSFVMQFIVVL